MRHDRQGDALSHFVSRVQGELHASGSIPDLDDHRSTRGAWPRVLAN